MMDRAQTLKLIDFDKYAVRHTTSNISSSVSIFIRQAWPIIRATNIQDPINDLLAEHAWLQPLITTSGSFHELIAMLDQSHNQATLAIMEMDTLLSNYYVTALFKSKLCNKDTAANVNWLFSQPDLGKLAIAESQKAFSAFQAIARSLGLGDPLETLAVGSQSAGGKFEELGFATVESRQARQRRIIFARRLETLCLQVGVPETVVSPLPNIYALRKLLSTQPQVFPGREASLQLQVDELTERTRWQGRVITNLMYRRLMERLTATEAGDSQIHRQRWTAFFDQAMQNAQQSESGDGQTNTHPFATILSNSEDATRREYVTRLGQELYDSVDANIRACNIEYRPAGDQWDAIPLALLQAMRPIMYGDNGEVDWEAERQRFLNPSTCPVSPASERRVNGPSSGPVPPEAATTHPPPYSSV